MNSTRLELEPGSPDSTHQEGHSSVQRHAAAFRTTQWALVLCAGGETARADDALEKICRAYWYPLYAFVRRQGYSHETSQDLTQGFFAQLLKTNSLAQVHPGKGRFRSFLLASLKHFLTNEWHRSQCQKRGGGLTFFSLEEAREEEQRRIEPVNICEPEKLFDRRWAETVLTRVNQRLRTEYEAVSQLDRFEALKLYLLNDYNPVSYADTAQRLRLSESAVKSAIHKLRKRYAVLFRAEIAHTVGTPDEIDSEIQHLLRSLS